MISKELFNVVIGINADKIVFSGNLVVFYERCKDENGWYDSENINIYELAHKCKEWALTYNYYIASNCNGAWVYHYDDTIVIDDIAYACPEPESIFQACQWILENR